MHGGPANAHTIEPLIDIASAVSIPVAFFNQR